MMTQHMEDDPILAQAKALLKEARSQLDMMSGLKQRIDDAHTMEELEALTPVVNDIVAATKQATDSMKQQTATLQFAVLPTPSTKH